MPHAHLQQAVQHRVEALVDQVFPKYLHDRNQEAGAEVEGAL